jgi:hypothetical protein
VSVDEAHYIENEAMAWDPTTEWKTAGFEASIFPQHPDRGGS